MGILYIYRSGLFHFMVYADMVCRIVVYIDPVYGKHIYRSSIYSFVVFIDLVYETFVVCVGLVCVLLVSLVMG